MTSFGPPRRVVNDTKLGKHRTHERQENGESYREAHNGARFTSYTEKSLLVVKDYVYMEKTQSKDEPNFTETFHGMPNVPRYMWDTAVSLARRESVKKKKQRTWLPNGGGIKPYNAPEAFKPAAPEECIIDVKAVKPRVDTWFRPKNKRAMSPEELTSSKTKESPHGRSPPRSPQRAATVVPSLKRASVDVTATRSLMGTEENIGDSAVKNLTSYWNDHLKRHPFTMSAPQKLQKSDDPNKRRDRGDDWRKISQNSQTVQESRPKSVGSDGVVQEHTLVPSKVLADKKMASVEDILIFVKRSGAKTAASASAKGEIRTCLHRSPARHQDNPREASILEKPEICDNKPVFVPPPPPSPKIQPARKPTTIEHLQAQNRRNHRHPLFVVRLHTRWILALKVLTLTFRPLVEAWKRRWHSAGIPANKSTARKYELCQEDKSAEVSCRPLRPSECEENSDKNKKSTPRARRKGNSQKSCSSKIGRIKMLARRGMSDTLKVLSRTRRQKLVTEDKKFAASETFVAVTNQNEPLAKSCVSLLTDRKPTVERTPLVTELVVSSSSGPVVVYDEAKSSTSKSASLEVLPGGLRMSLYVEYQLMISFVVVQSTLFVVVLLIKWLQEYTA